MATLIVMALGTKFEEHLCLAKPEEIGKYDRNPDRVAYSVILIWF